MQFAVPGNWVLLGKVIRPHGLQGLLRIQSYAQSERSFLDAGAIGLKPVSGGFQKHEMLSLRPHKKGYVMKLSGVTSIDQAEALRGAEIWIDPDSLFREADEYFWYELLGLEVYLDSGEYVGVISRIIQTGSHDIYEATDDDREVFIPATHEVVQKIDLGNKKMTISPIPGLLELNEV
ncbi:MAG: ribosome maturation factor RimM [Desulfatiglandaceae bacterium]